MFSLNLFLKVCSPKFLSVILEKFQKFQAMNKILILFSLFVCLNYSLDKVKANNNDLIETKDNELNQNTFQNPIK